MLSLVGLKNLAARFVLAAVALAVAPGALPGGQAAAYELLPHKALYRVTLENARRGSGVAGVAGKMFAEWSETCQGWTLDHRSLFDITYAPGPTVRLTSNVSTWASRDGLAYRFTVSNRADGKVAETVAGEARLDGPGKAGRVAYSAPAAKTVSLPAGTVFPTAHSRRIIEAAARAPTIVSLTVFDGLTEPRPFQVNAVIGRPQPPAASPDMAALKGLNWWPLNMAFFPLGTAAAEPQQEYGMRMFENGVGDRLLLDFGDFTLRANLIRVELGEKPACGA